MTAFCRLLTFLFLFALPVQQAASEPRFDASITLVENLVSRIKETISGEHSPESIRTETNNIINTYFDYPLVARFAAGRAWRGAGEAEREEYLAVFREVLLALAETQFTYLRNIEYTSGNVTPKGPKLVLVSGMVHDKTGKYPDANVAWRVSTPKGKPPKIIDIEVENISMLITQQQENTSIINSNGGSFQALIDALRTQAEEIKAKAAGGS